MSDYIEREAVEIMLENAQIVSDGEYSGYCTEDVNLGQIPAADVAPVRHGRWIPSDYTGDCCYTCSECGFVRDAYLLDVGNYCPACGTLMDGKEGEHEAD